MINVKLIVLILCFNLVSSTIRYCEICRNHTLCKYKRSGLSSSCKDYDESSHLTKEDIANIVSKINERRNFVALGLSRLLPQAANMNKVYWSEMLAEFAQRWVDQCDPETRPDQEDECRDLEDTAVGQNIVSVTGPAPGMVVRSLVDVWFTEGLDYSGSVTYYNYSRDWKTNYFSQLIWADTDRVGCGKAKFYVSSRNTMIERLVCNFAPKGNINGKPLYAIGYPATQCKKDMVPDKIYTGLCTHMIEHIGRKFASKKPPVSSLLRILNLSNNSTKLDIDPVRNNLRYAKFNQSNSNEQRSQKIRHVYLNNSYVAKSVPQPPIFNNRNYQHFINTSRNEKQHQFPERGHSRVYHGHDHGHEFHDFNHRTENKPLVNQVFRKFDYSTDPIDTASTEDYRKYGRNNECTRNIHNMPVKNDCKTTCQSVAADCTRGHPTENCAQTTKSCEEHQVPFVQHQFPHEQCPCNIPTTCAPTPSKCPCHLNCPCYTTLCPFTRSNDKDEIKVTTEPQYHDAYPNIAIRSGDTDKQISPIFPWLQQESTVGNKFKSYSQSKKTYNQGYIGDVISYKKYTKRFPVNIYDSSDSRERKRRYPADDMTFKPFWQMDEFSNQKVSLKSLKYTTLPNRKNKKNKPIITTARTPFTTETITIQLKDTSVPLALKNVATEKYLSFDELMHLRRIGTTETTTTIVVNARRTAANETQTTYERKKHCTRKLTCTWTAASVIDGNGSIHIQGMEDLASRTPWGYVEGCTRTSTCTRDFLDRNKFSSLRPDDVSVEDGDGADSGTGNGDEEYCEKRALNVRRRDSELDEDEVYSTHPNTLVSPTTRSSSETEEVTSNPYYTSATFISSDYCGCSQNSPRVKRNKHNVFNERYTLYGNLSYGDLYYVVLQRILNNLKNHRNPDCMCNSSVLLKNSIFLITFIFMYTLILNIFI